MLLTEGMRNYQKFREYHFDTFDGESNDDDKDAELGSLTIIDDKLEDK